MNQPCSSSGGALTIYHGVRTKKLAKSSSLAVKVSVQKSNFRLHARHRQKDTCVWRLQGATCKPHYRQAPLRSAAAAVNRRQSNIPHVNSVN
jgi:hypothetical protein